MRHPGSGAGPWQVTDTVSREELSLTDLTHARQREACPAGSQPTAELSSTAPHGALWPCPGILDWPPAGPKPFTFQLLARKHMLPTCPLRSSTRLTQYLVLAEYDQQPKSGLLNLGTTVAPVRTIVTTGTQGLSRHGWGKLS